MWSGPSLSWIDLTPAAWSGLVAWWLEGALLLLLTAALIRALPRLSAADRHWIWALGLATTLVLPLASTVLPTWALPRVVALDRALPEASGSAAPVRFAPTPWPHLAPEPRDLSRPAGDRATPVTFEPTLPSPESRPVSWPTLALALWGLGVALRGLSRARALLRRRRLLAGASGAPPELMAEVDELRRHLGIRRPLRVGTSTEAVVPMTWGTLWPVLLLPSDAPAWAAGRRREVLTHEIAHVRRLDSLTQSLGWLLVTCRWPDPLTWLALRALRREAEHSCDDEVLDRGAAAARYAGYLLQSARALRATPLPTPAVVAMADRPILSQRIASILDEGKARTRLPRRARVAGLLLAFTLAAGVGAGSLAESVPEPPAPPVAPSPPSEALPVAPEVAVEPPEPTPPATLEPWTGGNLGEPAEPPTAPRAPEPVAEPHPEPPTVPTPGIRTRPPLPPAPEAPVSAVTPPTSVRAPVASPSSRAAPAPAPVPTVAPTPAPTPAVAPPVPSPQPAGDRVLDDLAGDRCRPGWFSRRGTSTHIETDDDRAEISIRRGTCQLEVRWEGRLELAPGGDRIARLGRGGSLTLTETTRDGERRLHLEPGPNGVPEFRFWIDGEPARFDAEAQGWLDRRLPALFRATGLLAAERVEKILASRGVAGVLAEVEAIGSDYVSRIYLQSLLGQARLDDAQLGQLLHTAGRLESDFELGQVLLSVVAHPRRAEALPGSFFAAASTLESDFESRRVLEAALQPRQSEASLAALLDAAAGIDSDFELATLLVAVAGHPNRPSLPAAFFAALRSIDSSFERARASKAAVATGALEASQLVSLLEIARAIHSGFERATLLVEVANGYPIDGSVREAYLRAAEEIPGSHDRDRALHALRR